jgi:hypothetical protein
MGPVRRYGLGHTLNGKPWLLGGGAAHSGSDRTTVQAKLGRLLSPQIAQALGVFVDRGVVEPGPASLGKHGVGDQDGDVQLRIGGAGGAVNPSEQVNETDFGRRR